MSLEAKEDMLQELKKIIDQEKHAPEKTYLQKAWDAIQREIKALSRYPYVDDQLEIDEIWNICEEAIKSGKIREETWEIRKGILLDIIKEEYYDQYSVSDPMRDLRAALCLTPEEEQLYADLVFNKGSAYMKRDGVKLYKKHGKMDKYCKYMEEFLQNEQAQYVELIEYYRETNPEKAVEIAETGFQKCKDDQTEIVIFLLQHAQQMGDQDRFAGLLKSAKLRRRVSYAKVQERLGV